MKIFTVQNISDTHDHIPVFLVNLEHLPGCVGSGKAEHGHLQGYLIYKRYVLFDALDALGQHDVTVHVYHVLFSFVFLGERDPSIPIRVDT